MSVFEAQFAGRLLDNLQFVLERDVNARLAELDGELDQFEKEQFIGFRTPPQLAVNFPALYLEPAQSALDQSADDSRIDQQHEFIVSLSITGPDADALKSRAVKYVTAIDRTLRRMSFEDLAGSGPTTKLRRASWEVTEHRYGVLLVNDTIYRRNAQLVLVVQIFER